MSDLAVLRTAKQAYEEGLIEKSDYDAIKTAFLKAQQIKAGLDAGFIGEGLYEQARDSFLHSLDFSLVGSTSPPPQQLPASSFTPAEEPRQFIHARPQAAPVSGLTHFAVPKSAPRPLFNAPPPVAPPRESAPAPSQIAPIVNFNTLSKSSSFNSATAGKKSMCGISVKDECLQIYNQVKTRSTYKWVIFCVNSEGTEVTIEKAGPPDADFRSFLDALPEHHCRYAIFDYRYQNADTLQSINKLVFIAWSPETASIKHKMMYASTKDLFKGFMDGVGAELQATSADELSEADVHDRVHQAITRK